LGLFVVVAILAVLASLPRAFAQSKAVLKSYTCPADRLDATADQIRSAFKKVPELRVAVDKPSGQILVHAPADVHAQIAGGLNPLATPSAPAATPAPPETAEAAPAAESNPITATNVALQNLTAQDFETKLQSVLKTRLAPLTSLKANTNRYHLTAARGEGVEVTVDPANNQVSLRGPSQGVLGASRLVRAMDIAETGQPDNIRMIAYQAAKTESMKKAMDAVRMAEAGRGAAPTAIARLEPNQIEGPMPGPGGPPGMQPNENKQNEKEEGGGLTGSVQVELLEGLDVIVIRGKKKDIDQVTSIIEQIEKLSTQTEPSIEIYPLANVNCEAVSSLLIELYGEVYQARLGSVKITPLVKPNSLLLVGRKENVKTVIELAKKLDTPISPDSEFRVFPLKHATASSVVTTIMDFYTKRSGSEVGLSPRVYATSDVRSNAVIVQAGPRDMMEIAALIKRLDTPTSPVVNEVQIVKLEHTLADQLVSVLQGAFNVKGVVPQTNQQGGFNTQFQNQMTTATPDQRSAILRFLTIDAKKGAHSLQSGILNDVRITADVRSNSVVVSAPAESMELLVTLIHELDRLPLSEAQVKVFTITNGDASALTSMLQQLFTSSSQQRGGNTGNMFGGGMFGGNMQNQQTVVLEGGESLIPVRLAVDTRTNSIIASGDKSNLDIMEALLLRLDGTDVRNRKNHVYRLKNSPADQVGQAIQQYLQQVQQMQSQSGGILSSYALVEQEVIVVPETVSNSLIVSATPKYYDDIERIIKDIDARPPMVLIQVLLAEVTLNDNEEFGVELGLQDGLLFDRSTALTAAAAGTPGYNFVGQALGNGSTANASQVGSQGTTNFSLGRSNGNLGYGGFTFSASSESVSLLIRALKENDRLEILSRPQVQTLDNQTALIFSGKQVPFVGNTSSTSFGQNYQVTDKMVGLQLQVTPRISPDNLVVMYLTAINSAVDPGAGVPVTAVSGQVITQPIINTTQAQTTVSAMDGHTIVLGGLITKTKSEIHRKVPWLGDVPYLGRLFRYELLIIMTPHVVRTQEDADAMRKLESSRMNWCLADVIKLTGDDNLRQRGGDWSDKETPVVYPDLDPRASKQPAPEAIPTPSGESGPAPLPPEPTLNPESNKSSATPIRAASPTVNRLPPAHQETEYRPQNNYPPVQPANYERPAQNTAPQGYPGSAPIYYDAYPTTQTPVYR
jgi:type II secretion system protein D